MEEIVNKAIRRCTINWWYTLCNKNQNIIEKQDIILHNIIR